MTSGAAPPGRGASPVARWARASVGGAPAGPTKTRQRQRRDRGGGRGGGGGGGGGEERGSRRGGAPPRVGGGRAAPGGGAARAADTAHLAAAARRRRRAPDQPARPKDRRDPAGVCDLWPRAGDAGRKASRRGVCGAAGVGVARRDSWPRREPRWQRRSCPPDATTRPTPVRPPPPPTALETPPRGRGRAACRVSGRRGDRRARNVPPRARRRGGGAGPPVESPAHLLALCRAHE